MDKSYKQQYQDTRTELERLLAWCTSGRRYKTNNPYCIDEIKHAMKVLAHIDNLNDWLNLPLDTAKYNDSNYEFKDTIKYNSYEK